MVVRAERGRAARLPQYLPPRPHALVSARRGHLKSAIHCAAHALTYSFDGHLVEGATPGDLAPLELAQPGRLLLVRAGGGAATQPVPPGGWEAFAALLPREVTEVSVAADWKLIVEQWLESPQPQQQFVAPNQLLDIRPTGALILQVVPSAAGRSRIRRFNFAVPRAAGSTPRGAVTARPGSPPRSSWPNRRTAVLWAPRKITRTRAPWPRRSRSSGCRSRRCCRHCRLGEAGRGARQTYLGNALAQQVVELQHAVLEA